MDNNIRDFVRWSDTDPLALAGQLQARVKEAKDNGQEVGFAAVLVTLDETGVATYTPCFTILPAEILLMCGRIIDRRVDNQIIAGGP